MRRVGIVGPSVALGTIIVVVLVLCYTTLVLLLLAFGSTHLIDSAICCFHVC